MTIRLVVWGDPKQENRIPATNACVMAALTLTTLRVRMTITL
jgi:hypothetical protein